MKVKIKNSPYGAHEGKLDGSIVPARFHRPGSKLIVILESDLNKIGVVLDDDPIDDFEWAFEEDEYEVIET